MDFFLNLQIFVRFPVKPGMTKTTNAGMTSVQEFQDFVHFRDREGLLVAGF